MKILWIAANSSSTPTLVPGLRKKGYRVETVRTGRTALEILPSLHPNLAVVNAAAMRSSGQRICRTLQVRLKGQPILLIHRQDQHNRAASTSANQVLVLPFTVRKLVNRIRVLLPESNGQGLEAGPLTLFHECHTMQVKGKKPQKLTPRLAALLKMLMAHPGEVIERERLFRKVWQTDYVGDTRTLDVHISWLRKKIGARHSGLLKTIRGVGFRLDV